VTHTWNTDTKESKKVKEMLGEENTRKTPKEKHHRTGGKQANKGFK